MEVVETKKSVIVKLYWDDLTEETQNKIREVLNLDENDYNNWDVFPFTMFEFDKEAYGITDKEVDPWEQLLQKNKLS